MAQCCNTKMAGRINGNALNGLCERTCIAVKKVFDGCVRNFSSETFSLAVSVEGVAPYVFTEARGSGNTTISNLVITQTSGARSRVTFTADTPITVIYSDASGVSRAVSATFSVQREVSLRLPSEAITPYEIEVATGLFANVGVEVKYGAML